jgi:hypothetical protein
MPAPIAKAIEPHHPKRNNAEKVLDALYSVPETDILFEDFLTKLITSGKSDLAFHIVQVKRLGAIADTLTEILAELKTHKNQN